MYMNSDLINAAVKEFKDSPILGKAAAIGIVCLGAGYLLNAVTRAARSFRRP